MEDNAFRSLLSRRAFLGGTAGLAAMSLAACAKRDLPGAAGSSGSGDLTIGIPGGSLAAWAREIIKNFEKDTGTTVAIEEGVSTSFITKLKAAGGNTPFSLVTVDENFVVSATDEGLLQELPDSITNLTDVFDEAVVKDRHGVGMAFSRDTIYFNEEAVDGGLVPSDYADILVSDLLPRVAIPHLSLGVGVEFLVGLTAAVTSSSFVDAQQDLMPGIDALADAKGQFRTVYTGINDILPLLGSGEIWVTFGKSRQVNDVIRAGATVVPAPIKDAFGGFNCLAVPDGAPRPDLAAELIDRLLDPASQTQLAEAAGAGPVNKKATVPEGTQGDIPTHEDAPDLTFIDWDVVNPQLPDLLEKFSKVVVS